VSLEVSLRRVGKLRRPRSRLPASSGEDSRTLYRVNAHAGSTSVADVKESGPGPAQQSAVTITSGSEYREDHTRLPTSLPGKHHDSLIGEVYLGIPPRSPRLVYKMVHARKRHGRVRNSLGIATQQLTGGKAIATAVADLVTFATRHVLIHWLAKSWEQVSKRSSC
jgi:hypothetical protein